MPLVYGLRQLMRFEDGKVGWRVDPDDFIQSHIEDMMGSYYGMAIVGQQYDPAKVGKQAASYDLAEKLFEFEVMKNATAQSTTAR